MSDNHDKRWAEALKRSLDKVTRDQLLYGNWVQDEKVNIITTATNQPTNPLTKDELLKALELIKKGDALQQKGIGRDWVCVINPRLEQPIKELSKQYVKVPSYVMEGFELNYIMGRRVFIIPEAPLNIEYMEDKTMRLKYAEYFERELEFLEKEDDEDKIPDGYVLCINCNGRGRVDGDKWCNYCNGEGVVLAKYSWGDDQ